MEQYIFEIITHWGRRKNVVNVKEKTINQL